MLHKIRELCVENGIKTLAELERKAGISTHTIYRWDAHEPNVYSVYRVAKILNTTVEEILKGNI